MALAIAFDNRENNCIYTAVPSLNLTRLKNFTAVYGLNLIYRPRVLSTFGGKSQTRL